MIEKPCLGPYEIVGKLGAGGMGIVYRAYHTTLHREVALKVLDSKLAEDDASQRRFVREMQVAAGLAHPGLIRVYDGGVLEDELFIAMELVEGHGLDWMVSRHAPVPWTLGLAVGSRVADPLQYLHEQKILHRDIKPSNVLVSKAGEVKLGDFGLARPAGGPQLTMPGELVGTLLFMPPEALLGDPSTELSDLWALGCVLYLLITGQPHVTATNYNELVQGVLAGPIPPPSRLVHDLPAEVSQLILALLARNPDHRIRSAREVKERIDALVLTHAGTTPDLVLSDGFLDRIQAGPPQAPSTSPPGDSTERLPVDELERSPRTQVSKNRRALPEAPGPPGRSDASGTVAPDRPAGSAGPEPADSGAGRAAGQRPPSGPGSRPSRPSSPGVPRVRNVTPPPTAPLCRSPWPVAALCGTLAVAGLLAVMRTGPCQPPPPTTRVRPPSPGSPASSPASPSATSIFMEWKRLVPFLPRLRSTSTVAKKAVDEIRKVSRLDVGLGKEVWIHWLEMGMWLANPGRSRNPPHYRKTLHVQLDPIEEQIALGSYRTVHELVGADGRPKPELYVLGLHAVGVQPTDGRHWLVLGRTFDLDRMAAEALVCYGMALDRMAGKSLQGWNSFIWEGLARALMVVPGRNLEREWWAWARDDVASGEPFLGLQRALGATDPALFERILRAGLDDPGKVDRVTCELAYFQTWFHRRPDLALGTLESALARRPDLPMTRVALCTLHLRHGRPALARKYAGGLPPRNRLLHEWVATYQESPALGKGQRAEFPLALSRDLQAAHIETFRRLEAQDVDGAEELAAERWGGRTRADGLISALSFDLMAAGSARKFVEPDCRFLLFSEKAAAHWSHAAGAFARSRASEVMGRYLAEAGRVWPGDPFLPVIRALWMTRRGQLKAGQDELAKAISGSAGRPLPSAACCEILSRPFWVSWAKGEAAPRGASVPAQVGAQSSPGFILYWQRFREGDLAGAARAARELHDLEPFEPVWGLAVAWIARWSGDRPSLAEWIRCVRASVRYHGRYLWALQELEELETAPRSAPSPGSSGPGR